MSNFEWRLATAVALLLALIVVGIIALLWLTLKSHPAAIRREVETARKAALETSPGKGLVPYGKRANITTADLQQLKNNQQKAIEQAVKKEQKKHAKTYKENRKWRALNWTRKRMPWKHFDEGARQVLDFYWQRLYSDPREDAQAAVSKLKVMLGRLHPAHKAPKPPRRKDELLCFLGGEQLGLKAVQSIHEAGLWQSLVDQLWHRYQEAGRQDALRREGLLNEGGEDETGMGELGAGATAAPTHTANYYEDEEIPQV